MNKNRMFYLKIDKPMLNFFNLLPRITLMNFDNAFAIGFGFLMFSGELGYVKKYWRK